MEVEINIHSMLNQKIYLLHFFCRTLTGPPQWPDRNRYVKSIFQKLYRKFPKSTTRWNLIIDAYQHIRDGVIDNARIMRETNIQLYPVNVTTLIQWHDHLKKDRERSVLHQGNPLQSGLPTAMEELPRPREGTAVKIDHPFQFDLPPNTAGMATKRRNTTPASQSQPTKYFVIAPKQFPHPVSKISQPVEHISSRKLAPAPVIEKPSSSSAAGYPKLYLF